MSITVSLVECVTIFATDIAVISLEMPTIRIHDEADETIEICAIINGLPAEGLESDITIDLDVANGSAGDFT